MTGSKAHAIGYDDPPKAEEAPLLDVAEHVCEMYPFTGPALADSLLRRFAKRPETRAVWDRRKKDFSPPHTEDF